MPAGLWEEDAIAEGLPRRTTSLSRTGSGRRFSTRDYSVDQSLFGEAHERGGREEGGTSGSLDGSRRDSDGGYTSGVVALFRGGRTGDGNSSEQPIYYDEYGDAVSSNEAEEYISEKGHRQLPLPRFIQTCLGKKFLRALIIPAIVMVILLIFFHRLGTKTENKMRDYIIEKGISSASSFNSESSPQSLALKWLKDSESKDGEKILVPDAPGIVDRYILAVFYYGSMKKSGNKKWKSSEHWLSNQGVCSWEGVECIPRQVEGEDLPIKNYDEDASILGLILPGNQMNGTIPNELASLPGLMTLDLSDNGFTGTIPKSFGKMEALRNLFLRENRLTGTFPEELTALTKLFQLHIGENNLKGHIPETIGLMTSLRGVSVASNEFEGFFPYLEPCKKLLRIHVENNQFQATLPAWLSHMTDLSK